MIHTIILHSFTFLHVDKLCGWEEGGAIETTNSLMGMRVVRL